MPKIQTSSFVGGPNDKLAAVDVYKPSTSAANTSKDADSSKLLASILETLKKPVEGTVSNVEDMLQSDSYKHGATKARIEDFLANTSNLPGGSVAQITKHLPIKSLGPGLNAIDAIQDGAGNTLCATILDVSLLLLLKELLEGLFDDDFDIGDIADLSALALIGVALLALLLLYCMREAAKKTYTSLDSQVRKFVGISTIPSVINPKNKVLPSEDEIVNDAEGAIYVPTFITSDKYKLKVEEPRNNNLDNTAWGHDPSHTYWKVFRDARIENNPNVNANVNKKIGISDNAPEQPLLEGGIPNSGVDLEMLNFFIDDLTGPVIMGRYPDAIRNILQNYKLPHKGVVDLEGEYTNLINTIVRLDPNWDTTTRNGVTVPNLFNFSKMSKDAVYLLSTYSSSNYVVEALIAKSYLKNEVPKLLRAQFPKAGV